MSVLLSTSLLFSSLFRSASPPLLHLGSVDSFGSSFERISIREAVFSVSVQASSHINASPSFCLPPSFPGSGSLQCHVTSVYVERQVAHFPRLSGEQCLELKCQQSGRGKSAFPLTLGVISGWNELASCQGNHLVTSVVLREREKEIITLRKKAYYYLLIRLMSSFLPFVAKLYYVSALTTVYIETTPQNNIVEIYTRSCIPAL